MGLRTVEEAVKAAVAMSAFIRAGIQNRESRGDDWRGILTATMCDLALEHQHAIAALIHQKCPGSALALLRPLREATNRAYWLAFCSDDEHALAIAREEQAFPDAKKMHAEIEEALGSRKAVLRFQISKRERDVLHGFTHAGIEQLKFRITPDRVIRPRYPAGLLMKALQDATECALFVAFVLLRELGEPEEGLGRFTERFNNLFAPEG